MSAARRATWRCKRRRANDAAPRLANERAEVAVIRAAFDAELREPKPLFFGDDYHWLSCDFTILAELPDCETPLPPFSGAEQKTLTLDL